MLTPKILLLALSLCLGTATYASESVVTAGYESGQTFGIANYGKETLEAVKFNGNLTLDGTTIKGLLYVNGRLKADGADIGELEVNGSVALRDTQVQGASVVNGLFEAKKSTLGPLSIAARTVKLVASEVESIQVRQITGLRITQNVELKDGTIVNGDIVFDGDKGEVIIDATSKVRGSVKGAKVINSKK